MTDDATCTASASLHRGISRFLFTSRGRTPLSADSSSKIPSFCFVYFFRAIRRAWFFLYLSISCRNLVRHTQVSVR
jgi:hypothetical protein